MITCSPRPSRWSSLTESSTEGADDYRQSFVIYDAGGSAASIPRSRARSCPRCRRLAVPPLPPDARTELQLTAHNDGHFYKVHNDNDSLDAAARELSFIYYAHRWPRGFSGGELLVYEREGHYGIRSAPARPRTDRARRQHHRVLPQRAHARGPPRALPVARAFADSRFTLNGWVWR